MDKDKTIDLFKDIVNSTTTLYKNKKHTTEIFKKFIDKLHDVLIKDFIYKDLHIVKDAFSSSITVSFNGYLICTFEIVETDLKTQNYISFYSLGIPAYRLRIYYDIKEDGLYSRTTTSPICPKIKLNASDEEFYTFLDDLFSFIRQDIKGV